MTELDTFLADYEAAANSRDFDRVVPYIADNAIFWFTNGVFKGRVEIKRAFEATWDNIQDETYTLSNTVWLVKTDRIAVCTYNFTSNGKVEGKHQVYEGHGTNVIQKIKGKWQIAHEHLSKLPNAT